MASTEYVRTLECIESDSECRGDVYEYTSRSGCTVSARCMAHQDAHDDHMNEVVRGLNERYPGWNSPGSVAPDWFDPADAGERWDDDY